MGQRFRALHDLQVEVIPAWGPHDASRRAVLPAGEAFAVGPDPLPGAREAYCVADGYERLHGRFVPGSWLSDELYQGYYLRVSLDDIAGRCEPLAEGPPEADDEERIRLVIEKLESMKSSGAVSNPEVLTAIDEELSVLRSKLRSSPADA
jgi:hypothetical protein